MIYALAAIIVVQTLLIGWLTDQARKERKSLEDRLLAMTNLDAAILVKAQEDDEPGSVTYVDEEREWQLSPGGGGRG